MIDFEKIKKYLAESNSFTKYSGATILNGNLINYMVDEETFAISITEEGGQIVLSDFGETFIKLEEQDISMEDKDVETYVTKVLKTLKVALGPSNELLVKAKDEKDCVYALGRLYQAIILLSYLDLQFEYEEE